jgi:cytochrome c heme-lyase
LENNYFSSNRAMSESERNQTTVPETLPPKACGGCPMHEQSKEDLDRRQQPHPDQVYRLPTRRMKSSIPRATAEADASIEDNGAEGKSCPVDEETRNAMLVASQQQQQQKEEEATLHSNVEEEEEEEERWVYPSPQMFYNAMKRKGYSPSEQDVPLIVALHNSVNEQVWREILAWESLHAHVCPTPRLRSFKGQFDRPSPKARYRVMMGSKKPFDRHDWIVDRCGRDVHYVIDFYEGAAAGNDLKPIAMHLDVRPAVDSFRALYDRIIVGSGLVHLPDP